MRPCPHSHPGVGAYPRESMDPAFRYPAKWRRGCRYVLAKTGDPARPYRLTRHVANGAFLVAPPDEFATLEEALAKLRETLAPETPSGP